ncbi:heterokaryon incompatibility protein (het-6OR allele), partial [Fusarium pseudoanthophilum]
DVMVGNRRTGGSAASIGQQIINNHYSLLEKSPESTFTIDKLLEIEPQPAGSMRTDGSKSIADAFTEMVMMLLRAEGYNKVYELDGTMLDDLEPLELPSILQT